MLSAKRSPAAVKNVHLLIAVMDKLNKLSAVILMFKIRFEKFI